MHYRVVVLAGVISIVTILSILFYVSHKHNNVSEENIKTTEIAPEFNLPDAIGNNISLSEVEGKLKIINFWASWSPYSKDELSALVQLKKEYGKDLAIVALNRDVNPAEGEVFLESLKLDNVIVFIYDKNDVYFKKVGGYAMPETLFLDRDSSILMHKHGPMSYDEMNVQIQQFLNFK